MEKDRKTELAVCAEQLMEELLASRKQPDKTEEKKPEIRTAIRRELQELARKTDGDLSYQIGNIYETEEGEEHAAVELCTGTGFLHGNMEGFFTLYLKRKNETWELDEEQMREYLQEHV